MDDNTIYFDFFIHGMHFTCEDYDENTYAVYHENTFVAEINECDYKKAVTRAVQYYKECAANGTTI